MSKKQNSDNLDLDKTFSEELSKAEKFISKNGKVLTYVIGAIVVAVGAFIGYQQMVMVPNEAEAQEYLFKVQRDFASDSFSLVINGNGTDYSAVDIVDDYGMTDAGNLARFYAGFSYLYLGEYQNAIDYLEDFSSDDMIVGPRAQGGIGDAYSELGQYEEAANNYMKAAKMVTNDFTTPIYLKKAGLAYEKIGEHERALDVYTRIKDDFRKTEEAQDIEKYIARVEAKTGAFN